MALKSKIRSFFLRKGLADRDVQFYNNEFPNTVLYHLKQEGLVNKGDIILDTGNVKVISDNECCVETVKLIYENKDEEDDNTPVIELCIGSNTKKSFAIPDGQTMDPLAPTALAISTEFMERITSGLTLLRGHGRKVQKYVMKTTKVDSLRKSWKYVVNVTLVDAKGLPDGPDAGTNGLYCKFRLGSETQKSKLVSKTTRPSWRQGFNLYLYEDSNLEISVWHKGKQKNFMGKCNLDLTRLEKEKTHELWQELECGYGTVHLLVTISGTVRPLAQDAIPTSNGIHPVIADENKYAWYRLNDAWSEVGQLSVVVHSAKGLPCSGISRPDPYCVLELDNARVQTHCVRGSTEPTWKKCFTFGVNDVTSTLDISLYDESMINSMKADFLGKISIPLLRINNEEKRWYALKNRSKTSSARGNCPRLLVEMTMVWNPVKASLRVLTPKETKYLQKPAKFNIPLIYSNLEFIKKLFDGIAYANEIYKRLFEWDSAEKSAVALAGWLIFWYFYRIWMLPLLLLLPFAYNWNFRRTCNNTVVVLNNNCDEDLEEDDLDSSREEKKLKNRINGLQDLTLTIKNSIDYIVSFLERLQNLASFTVPYLSYLAITGLVAVAAVLFFVPANYLLMLLGVYKFTRKFMKPDRTPNNDLLDFVSRIPDNVILKEWRELKVPEPNIPKPN